MADPMESPMQVETRNAIVKAQLFFLFDGWSPNRENSYRTSGAIYYAVKGPNSYLASGFDNRNPSGTGFSDGGGPQIGSSPYDSNGILGKCFFVSVCVNTWNNSASSSPSVLRKTTTVKISSVSKCLDSASPSWTYLLDGYCNSSDNGTR